MNDPTHKREILVVSLKADWSATYAHAGELKAMLGRTPPKTPCTKGMAPDPARLPSISEICCRLRYFPDGISTEKSLRCSLHATPQHL